MYFAMSGVKPACRRRLLINHRTPILFRHGASWFFHFPEERQVSIRCPQGSAWITFNEVLSETGVIHNATACTIAAGEIRNLPELHGMAEFRSDIPEQYLPVARPMLSVHEEPKLEEMTSPETEQLDGIKSRLATPAKFWDVDTLLHIQQATVQYAGHTHWYLIISVASCTNTLLVLMYCYARTQWNDWLLCNPPQKSSKESNPVPQTSPSPTHTMENTVSSTGEDVRTQHDVTFAQYALPHAL